MAYLSYLKPLTTLRTDIFHPIRWMLETELNKTQGTWLGKRYLARTQCRSSRSNQNLLVFCQPYTACRVPEGFAHTTKMGGLDVA